MAIRLLLISPLLFCSFQCMSSGKVTLNDAGEGWLNEDTLIVESFGEDGSKKEQCKTQARQTAEVRTLELLIGTGVHCDSEYETCLQKFNQRADKYRAAFTQAAVTMQLVAEQGGACQYHTIYKKTGLKKQIDAIK